MEDEPDVEGDELVVESSGGDDEGRKADRAVGLKAFGFCGFCDEAGADREPMISPIKFRFAFPLDLMAVCVLAAAVSGFSFSI